VAGFPAQDARDSGPGLAVTASGGTDVRLIGIVLIVIGVIGFVFGGVSFTRDETVLDAGPIEIQTERRESLPITPIASGIALVAGVALLFAGGRRS
jgi:hypothetical protein